MFPSLGHQPTKPAAAAWPPAPGSFSDRGQPPEAGGSEGNKRSPSPCAVPFIRRCHSHCGGRGQAPPTPPSRCGFAPWPCPGLLLRVAIPAALAWALPGPTAGLSLGRKFWLRASWGIRARGVLCSQPPFCCWVPVSRDEEGAEDGPGHGLNSGDWGPEVLGVAVTLRGRAWPEHSVFSGACPCPQPGQRRRQQSRLGTTAM